MSGRFITFEGIEGVGKSTQIQHALRYLQAHHVVHLTREPGGTALAEKIRTLVLTPSDEIISPSAELLLMMSARGIHTTNLIKPALARGEWVLCDRYTDATRAYQGAGRGMDLALINQLSALCAIEPDLTILLDAPVELALERVASRRGPTDRFEQERVDFFERVRAGYLSQAQQEPQRFRIVDASLSEKEVAQAVQGVLDQWR